MTYQRPCLLLGNSNRHSYCAQRNTKQALIAILAFGLVFGLCANAQQTNVATRITPIINYLLFSDTSVGEEVAAEEASRFLVQTTFGPTYDEIAKLSNGSLDTWLAEQFSLPQTKTVDYAESQNWVTTYPLIVAGSARSSLLNVMLSAPDQLRQRMAYALSQIFVVSRDVNNGMNERPLYYLDYYDLLAENAFGNYRDLLEKVTKNSVMAYYLTLNLNAPAGTQVGPIGHPASFFVSSPDENYAREVLQLFSIGLVELNIDGTPKVENGESIASYTQETIENFARVFTGWNYQAGSTPENSSFFNLGIPRHTMPMIAFDEFHDMGEKTLLNNVTLPANQSAEKDLDDALDNIFNHPNVGPFIGKLLIQHFVTSNPSPAYVARVAGIFNNNGQGIRGDLQAVITTILLDTEARNGHQTMPNKFGKFKEPFIRQTALWRGLHARRRTSNNNMFDAYDTSFLRRLGQFPLEARSVFNFYQADFSPSGPLNQAGLLAPVSQLIDSESVVSIATTGEEYIQRHHDNATNSFASSADDLLIDSQPLEDLIPEDLSDVDGLIERLNLVFLGGAMSDEMRQVLREVHDPSLYLVEDKWRIAIDLANIIILSPQFMVQK